MKKKDASLKEFGFYKTKISKIICFFIVICIFVQPLILGIDFSLSFSIVFLIIVQMFLVGYTEEVLFRSIFYYELKTKGTTVFVVFSSITFGILHLATALNPESSPVFILLQVINALLLGFVFSYLYLATRSIYLNIIFHALFNIFASICKTVSIDRSIFAVLILCCLYLIFIGYLKRKVKQFS